MSAKDKLEAKLDTVSVLQNLTLIFLSLQGTFKRSQLVTLVPVFLWRTGLPGSPLFVALQGQNFEFCRVSSTTRSTLWWAWSNTPMFGRFRVCVCVQHVTKYCYPTRKIIFLLILTKHVHVNTISHHLPFFVIWPLQDNFSLPQKRPPELQSQSEATQAERAESRCVLDTQSSSTECVGPNTGKARQNTRSVSLNACVCVYWSELSYFSEGAALICCLNPVWSTG